MRSRFFSVFVAAAMGVSACNLSPGPGGSGGSGGGGTTGGGSGGTGGTAGGGAGGAGGTGGTGGGAGGNSVSGTIRGNNFPVAGAYWIGMIAPGSPPTQVYLLEAPLSCADISVPLWDKTLNGKQVLELDLNDAMIRQHQIGQDVIANYLQGAYNPDASSGSVTISVVNPSQNIVGSFQLTFGADTITGTFDATYCAAGIEP